MVVAYYIELSRTGPDKHNHILMSLLLLVAETTSLLRELKAHADGQFFRTFRISRPGLLDKIEDCAIT